MINEFPKELKKMCELINAESKQLLSDPKLVNKISENFGIHPDHSNHITKSLRWNTSIDMDNKIIDQVIEILKTAGILNDLRKPVDIIARI